MTQHKILVDDNGPPMPGRYGFRFEAELVGVFPFVFGFGDTQEEAICDVASKLGFDDMTDMKYEIVQRGEF